MNRALGWAASHRLLHFLLAIGFLLFALWQMDPGAMFNVIREADLRLALLAFLLNIPVLVLVSIRSFLVLSRLGHQVQSSILVPTMVLGYVAGALTPAASGELLRTSILRTRAGVPAEHGLALVLYERFLSVYLLAITTALLIASKVAPSGLLVVLLGLGVAVTLLPWVAAGHWRDLHFDQRVIKGRLMTRVVRYLLDMASQTRFLLAGVPLFVTWSLITMAVFALVALQFLLLAQSVSGDVSCRDSWIAFGASQLAGMASLIPLGLGVSDGSLAAILRRFGLTIEQGAGVAVLVRAATTLPLAIAAFGCYLYLTAGKSSSSDDLVAAPAGQP